MLLFLIAHLLLEFSQIVDSPTLECFLLQLRCGLSALVLHILFDESNKHIVTLLFRPHDVVHFLPELLRLAIFVVPVGFSAHSCCLALELFLPHPCRASHYRFLLSELEIYIVKFLLAKRPSQVAAIKRINPRPITLLLFFSLLPLFLSEHLVAISLDQHVVAFLVKALMPVDVNHLVHAVDLFVPFGVIFFIGYCLAIQDAFGVVGGFGLGQHTLDLCGR